MTPIEQKELRGISVKTLVVFLASVVSIIFSVAFTYSNLMNELKQITLGKNLQDVKITTLEIDLRTARADNARNEQRIVKLETQVEYLQKSKP